MHNARKQRGSAAMELPLVLLLFLSMIYAVLEFGRAVSAYNIIAGATREGTRYAMSHGDSSPSPASGDAIKNVVKRWAIGLDRNHINVSVSWPDGNSRGDTVRVQTSYQLSPMTAFILRSPINIYSRSEMLISQ